MTEGPWTFFTAAEAPPSRRWLIAIIPPDPETPGGKEAGCAVLSIDNRRSLWSG